MNQQKAFNFYFGLTLHFSRLEYSILKYGSNTKTAISKFSGMSPEQRYRFEWLSRKYPNTQDIVYLCIGCQFDDISVQFDTKDDVVSSYLKFKGRREAMTYTLKSELSKYEGVQIEKLIFKYFVREVSPELILLKTQDSTLLVDMYESPSYSFCRDKILKLIKYKDFFSHTKYTHLLCERETNLKTVL
jgi:hypothetical protein